MKSHTLTKYAEPRVFLATLANGNQVHIIKYKAHTYKDITNDNEGVTAELAMYSSQLRIPLGGITVTLLGANRSLENAEYIVQRIGDALWDVQYQNDHAAQEGLSREALKTPSVTMTTSYPLTLNANITRRFSQRTIIVSSQTKNISLLRLSDLKSSNKGIVAQLGLFDDNQLMGFLQVYVLQCNNSNQVLNAAITGAKSLWADWLA